MTEYAMTEYQIEKHTNNSGWIQIGFTGRDLIAIEKEFAQLKIDYPDILFRIVKIETVRTPIKYSVWEENINDWLPNCEH